jgi:hypothetical protein
MNASGGILSIGSRLQETAAARDTLVGHGLVREPQPDSGAGECAAQLDALRVSIHRHIDWQNSFEGLTTRALAAESDLWSG